MTFERSVKGILGCITFCEVAVTTRTRSSEHKGIPPQLQLLCHLQPWCRHGEWGSPPENGSGPRLPFQVEGHGEPGMELAAGPRSQVAPRTRLCPSQDPTPLRGPGAVREHGRRGEPSLWHLCCLPDWVSEEPSGTPASAEGSSPVQEGPEGRCVCGALGRPLRELCNHSVGPSRALRCLRVLSCSWGRQWSQPLSLTLHQVAEHGGCVTEASPLTEHGLLCKAFPVCLPPAQSPGLGSHTSCF